jgi:hypothetical protein
LEQQVYGPTDRGVSGKRSEAPANSARPKQTGKRPTKRLRKVSGLSALQYSSSSNEGEWELDHCGRSRHDVFDHRDHTSSRHDSNVRSTVPTSRPLATSKSTTFRKTKKPSAAVRAKYLRELQSTWGLTVTDIPADGDCLFRALALIVLDDVADDAVLVMRSALAAYMQSSPSLRARVGLLNTADLRRWVADTVRLGTYGDHTHVQVAEERFDVCIRVFSVCATTPTPMLFDERAYAVLGPRPRRALLYNGLNHYDALIHVLHSPILDEGSQLLADWRAHNVPPIDYAEVPVEPLPRATLAAGRDRATAHTTGGPVQAHRPTGPPAATSAVQCAPARSLTDAQLAWSRGRNASPPMPEQAPVIANRVTPASPSAPMATPHEDDASSLFSATSSDDDELPEEFADADLVMPGATSVHRRAIPGLQFPHAAEHQVNFRASGSAFLPPSVAQSIRLADRPVALLDVIVLASGVFPDKTAPATWQALSLCALTVYQAVAVHRCGFTVKFLCVLLPAHGAVQPTLPQYSVVPASSWFLQYVHQPALQGGERDAAGVTYSADSMGVDHSSSRGVFGQKISRAESISVLAGRDHLDKLRANKGNHVQTVCASVLVPGACSLYVTLQRALNPRNPYPLVPLRGMFWFENLSAHEDLAFQVLCFEFSTPNPFDATPCLRLAHFLPCDVASALPCGDLTERAQLLAALAGVGTTYGVLYQSPFLTAFEHLAATIRHQQLAPRLPVLFLEEIVLTCLARFHECTLNANRTTPFRTAADPDVDLFPTRLTPAEWAHAMTADIECRLRDATQIDALEFQRAMEQGIQRPVPLGFRRATSKPTRALPAAPIDRTPPQTGSARSSNNAPPVVLCLTALLHHYGLSSDTCPGRPSCTALHHAEINSFPYHRAERAVRSATMSEQQREALLARFRADPAKFHSIPGTSGSSPSRATPAGYRSAPQSAHRPRRSAQPTSARK